MKDKLRSATILALTIVVLLFASNRLPADTDTCGGAMTTLPFTDVMGNLFFCQIAEAFFSGLTNGTTPTTYSPSDNVTREQMAAFVTRTQDSALRRGSRRAALKQWSTPADLGFGGVSSGGGGPELVESDGADLWVANNTSGTVGRVRASDGRMLELWTGAISAFGVLVTQGRVYVTGLTTPGRLYFITPDIAPGSVFELLSNLGGLPVSITTDGRYIWTANESGSVSRVDPNTAVPTNFTTGFTAPVGILFDGANLWVADHGDNKLKRFDSRGAILQSVTVGAEPYLPVFDGYNVWVPNSGSNSLSVVRARDGMVLATLTGNGLNFPFQAAFDGQRVLVTNLNGASVSLWNATTLTPIGSVPTHSVGEKPKGACSDGINFWITLNDQNTLARF